MKQLIATLLFATLTTVAIAQPNMERMQAIRVAFITNALELNTTEAERFWPVHNEMTEALSEIREERRSLVEAFRDEDEMMQLEESVLLRKMNQMLELERQELAIRQEYHQKFLEVLDVHKVALLYRTEEEFKRQLLDRMRREERPPRGRR